MLKHLNLKVEGADVAFLQVYLGMSGQSGEDAPYQIWKLECKETEKGMSCESTLTGDTNDL